MAVVSISRIQIRRGRKTELPQLASGELGWSVDSQELYIGNGAVAEGAPYVGNTKLLSENDNLFQFANTYTYSNTSSSVQTGESPNTPILRTLQDRLDDIVSIRAFGATGDGSDQTLELQRALDQLYLNSANKGTSKSRVILNLEPGTYVISSTIKVPPYATIRGAGPDKTIINAGNHVAFETVNDSSAPGLYNINTLSNSNQPRNIEISGLTITTLNNDAIVLQSCKDSLFENIKMSGSWTPDGTEGTSAGIRLTAQAAGVGNTDIVGSNNNVFNNLSISNFGNGIYSDYDIKNNLWSNCQFETLDTGVNFGSGGITLVGASRAQGPIYNTIEKCTFDNIYFEGIKVIKGTHNTSKSNKFFNVGNHNGLYTNARSSNIEFTTANNYSVDDFFSRTENLADPNANIQGSGYIPEISGISISTIGYTYNTIISEQSPGTPTKLFALGADTERSYIVDYNYKSNEANARRSGTLEILIDPANTEVKLVDEYQYSGDDIWQEALYFSGILVNYGNGEVDDTLVIQYTNTVTNDTASVTYTIRTKTS